MKRIKANRIMKTLRFISKAGGGVVPVLEAKLNNNNLYECVIYLPLINKTVIGLGDDKLDSVDNATKKTEFLIDEYLKENPCFFWEFHSDSDYVLEEDNDGNLCMHLLKKGVQC